MSRTGLLLRCTVIVFVLLLGLVAPGAGLLGVQSARAQAAPTSDLPSDRAARDALLAASIGAVHVSAGLYHTCAVTTGGGVRCWGRNTDGQLGDGTTTNRWAPVDVVGLTSGVAAVSAGREHTCALTTSGGVKCWGHNFYGELGDGTQTGRPTPVDAVGLTSGVQSVSAGYYHTCALMTGGLDCWGYNADGQIGNGTQVNQPTPLQVKSPASNVQSISAGAYHTCVVTAAGVECWGDNYYGQLGDATTTDRLSPADVEESTGMTGVSAGYAHTCAVTAEGGVKCWGYNSDGQLGDGTQTNRSTPVEAAPPSGVQSVSAGAYHTCAVTTAGVECWGDNHYGELGDTTTTDRWSPADTEVLTSGVQGVSAGGYHTCAVTADCSVKCWGYNQYGQLGDGTQSDRWTAVDVIGLVWSTFLPFVVKP